MVFYLNTSLILIVISGLICLTFGSIFLINGYLKKKKNRVERGWGLSILGLLVFVFFLIALTRILKQEAAEGSGFIFSSFLLLFIFFPIAALFALVVSVFFLVIGINSLKEGYKKDDNGKRDIASIILGYIMLGLLVLVMTSIVMFTGVAFNSFANGLRKAYNSSSIKPSESTTALRYYLFSIIYG